MNERWKTYKMRERIVLWKIKRHTKWKTVLTNERWKTYKMKNRHVWKIKDIQNERRKIWKTLCKTRLMDWRWRTERIRQDWYIKDKRNKKWKTGLMCLMYERWKTKKMKDRIDLWKMKDIQNKNWKIKDKRIWKTLRNSRLVD